MSTKIPNFCNYTDNMNHVPKGLGELPRRSMKGASTDSALGVTHVHDASERMKRELEQMLE